MNRLSRVIRRAFLPAGVFLVVLLSHFVWLGLFPDSDSAQDLWMAAPQPPEASWWVRYAATQSYWLGLSYSLALSFAAIALRRYREERLCGARNLAIGGVTFSGFLAVAGCYLVGCCGSPMLVVYLNFFGAAFVPLAKPLVAAITAVTIVGAWLWMIRNRKPVAKASESCCNSDSPTGASGGDEAHAASTRRKAGSL